MIFNWQVFVFRILDARSGLKDFLLEVYLVVGLVSSAFFLCVSVVRF